MRILNLQNTVLLSLLVAGAAASAACSSSDASRPDATAGTGATTGGTGNVAGTTSTTGGTGTPAGGTGTAGSSSVAGTTATGGSGGAAAPSVCDGTASRVLMPTDTLIENFETITTGSTDATLAGPAWYAFSDLGPAGADAADSTFKILRTAGTGAGGTAFFGEYKGTAANIPPTPMAFGVGVEINVGVNPSIMQYCVDASAFTGVSFWAKVGSSAAATVIADFVVPSQNKPSPASVTAGMPDADCTGAVCYNFPQKSFTFTTEWQQYTLNFAGLKGATGATVAGNKIQQVEWLPQSKDWDLSLDEIAFYSGTPPAGAVGAPASGSGGTGSGGSGGSN